VEVLLRVLWKLLKEESKKSIYVLASSNGIADRTTTVGISDVDRLIQEDHRGIGIPGIWVVDELEVLIN